MDTIRSFIAIELPAVIQTEIARVIKLLSPAGRAVRWMAPQNIHLTLKFLGEVEVSDLEQLKTALKTECQRQKPFEIRVETLGAFPNNRRPRVIWIGVKAPPDLAALQHGIEIALFNHGYALEERPFSPHLTLGRVSQHASADEVNQLAALLAKTQVSLLGTSKVQSILLFRSDLRPGGPIYTRLVEADLNADFSPNHAKIV